MLENTQNDSYERKVVIRLINGCLRGCEFTLAPGRTMFIVCHADDLKHHHQGITPPDNTIYIPCSVPSPNFEIFVPESKNKSLVLHEYHENGDSEKEIESHKIIVIGEQWVCWRDEKDVFTEDILTEYAHQQNFDRHDQKTDEAIYCRKNSWWKFVAALLIIGCVSAAAYSYLNENQRKITSVTDFLDNKIGNYNVIYGKDNIIYILSESESAAQWAIQSMIRTPSPYRTKILTTDSEEHRIGEWLVSNWPQVKIHRIRLEIPEHPVIEISAERTKLTPAEMKRFTESVAKSINYAKDISVNRISDQSIRRLAIDGLEKLSLPFTEVKNSNSVTLVIRGAIDDGELERLKNFITHYSRVWKGEYVQFAMELKDDWLKGKSYKYGDRGYVKLSPGHWYFPRNIKKEL